LYLVISTAYIWDEDREWIPLGRSISFSSVAPNLPWRSVSHHAGSAYIIKATSSVFGQNALGYRIGFALAGAITVWAVGMLAWEWLGAQGCILAALALALNEYHLAVSAIATEKSQYLMCSALSILHFGRFLKFEKSRNLYLTAVFAGVAFLFKETSGLLLPACAAALLVSGKAGWFKRRETYIAAGLGFAIVLPDLFWNFFNWDKGYGLHTGRIAGLGFNRHFFLFFGRDLIAKISQALGRFLADPAKEYPAMNALWGAIVIGSALFAIVKWRKLQPIGRLVTIFFWCILLFFMLGKPGQTQYIVETQLLVDSKAWFWVDQVLIGSSVLVAWSISSLTGRWKQLGMAVFVLACLMSLVRVHDKLEMPTVQLTIVPNTIWPADGQFIDLKTFVLPCQICKPTLRLVESTTDDHDGRGVIPSSTEEIRGLMQGTDDREFQAAAKNGGTAAARNYGFRYEISDRGLKWSVSRQVVVSNRISPLVPFWARS